VVHRLGTARIGGAGARGVPHVGDPRSRDCRAVGRASSVGGVDQSTPPEVATVASIRDLEMLEDELAFEGESGLHEDEAEEEGIFGALGNALGGLLGEGEGEDELAAHELHEVHELEDELGSHELHEVHELEDEGEGEWELEGAEAFSLRKFVRRALPGLRQIAKLAAPAIGTAFGGPLGGKIGSLVAQNLEGELEDELEAEDELESHEIAAEYESAAHAEISESEAHAELMAAAAAGAASEAEAEALIGAATWAVLSPRERRELRRALPHMVRASAILTRLLRRRRVTSPGVRMVPFIVGQTARQLTAQSARTGRPVTRAQASRAMTANTRRVLSSPRYGTLALQRNVRATRRLQQVAQVPIRGEARPAAARRARY
jgi:hypothetical protein